MTSISHGDIKGQFLTLHRGRQAYSQDILALSEESGGDRDSKHSSEDS